GYGGTGRMGNSASGSTLASQQSQVRTLSATVTFKPTMDGCTPTVTNVRLRINLAWQDSGLGEPLTWTRRVNLSITIGHQGGGTGDVTFTLARGANGEVVANGRHRDGTTFTKTSAMSLD